MNMKSATLDRENVSCSTLTQTFFILNMKSIWSNMVSVQEMYMNLIPKLMALLKKLGDGCDPFPQWGQLHCPTLSGQQPYHHSTTQASLYIKALIFYCVIMCGVAME